MHVYLIKVTYDRYYVYVFRRIVVRLRAHRLSSFVTHTSTLVAFTMVSANSILHGFESDVELSSSTYNLSIKQEVTRLKAILKPNLAKKSKVDGGAIRRK